MPSSTSTLFISAVTDEFGSYRTAVAKFLDAPGARIEIQERFVAAGQTMLVKLSDYIRQCDAVVHLIGDRAGNQQVGAIANPSVVRHLLEALSDLPRTLELDAAALNALTYTQWEAWLAIYHRKRLFIAVPEPMAPRDSNLTDTSEAERQIESQHAHLARLASKGRYPEIRFGNSDQLCLGLVPLRDFPTQVSTNDIALTNVLSLADYRAGLGGFRRFLSSEHLPFQAPPRGTPSHPEELLKSLETSVDGRGVLLSGVGGVGKTRTTLETAQLAEGLGWRIVYVLPGQPAATAEAIMEAVLGYGPGKTMVVIEYLDQMHELDLGVLRRHVIQTASRQSIQFGLIANCRPGWLLKPSLERDATFERITLDLSATDARRLSSYVAGHTAPMALSSLGSVELMRLCGHRPIIALLVAQQLEQLAMASRLYSADFAAVRSGDLAHWLRRRLAADGLIVPEPDSIWKGVSPEPHIVAAAAALACAPDNQNGLTAAAASALQSVGHSSSTAARVVSVLVSVGWLEREGSSLQTVHDVVADEVVEQVSFDLDTVRIAEVKALLSPAINRVRSLGCIAKTLTRVEGALSPHRAESLRTNVGQWLGTNAAELGRVLANADPDTGSYALGALLGGSLMEDFAIEYWITLVTPWLDTYKSRYEARHVLFRGLRSRQNAATSELISIAMAWLEHWGTEQGASFVIRPLLHIIPGGEALSLTGLRNNSEKKDDAEITMTGVGLRWEKHLSEKVEAKFVLHPLLDRLSLTAEPAEQVTSLAVRWLMRFNEKQEAGFVLQALLDRSDLKADVAERAITLALQWLARFSDKQEAEFVLHSLLGREDVQAEAVELATNRALDWLARFSQQEDAGFVLQALLGRADLKEDLAEQVFALAQRWLMQFMEREESQFVFHALLSRTDLDKTTAEKAITMALQWLAGFIANPTADFVLNPLLNREDLKGVSAEQVISLALQRLTLYKAKEEAQFVLHALLGRADLQEETASQAITLALVWLPNFIEKQKAEFVLNPLLDRADLTGERAAKAIELALQWLSHFGEASQVDFVLRHVLNRSDLKGENAEKAIALALRWLPLSIEKPETGFVLRRMLGRTDLMEEAAQQAITLALRWLRHFSQKVDVDFVLRPLLKRDDLKGDPAQQAITLALRWLARFSVPPQGDFVLRRLLGRADLKGAAAAQAVAFALQWLAKFGGAKRAGFVLTPLLEYIEPSSISTGVAVGVLARVKDWVRIWEGEPDAGFVLVQWFISNWSSIDRLAGLREAAEKWAAAHPLEGSGGPALAIELSLRAPTDEEATKLRDTAKEWIGVHEGSLRAASVLSALLEWGSGDESIPEFVARHALNIAQEVGAVRVRRLLRMSMIKLPANHPLKHEIEILLISRGLEPGVQPISAQ